MSSVTGKVLSMKHKHISILGGGLAGLAAGYYARKYDIPFALYEATGQVGGNCITFRHGEFSFDSGAHRFHDRIPEITNEIKGLLRDGFDKMYSPNSIYFQGRFIDFPLSPLDLLRKLGPAACSIAGAQLLGSRISRRGQESSFKDFAVNKYGKSIAEFFLLGYSEKLWGLPSDRLSARVSGSRMKGLDLRVFLKEMLLGRKAKTEHLDGAFYYPSHGIGAISKRLEEVCDARSIRKKTKITKVIHNKKKISAIEVNGSEKVDADFVISTLPLNLFLQMMDPLPRKEILDLSKSLRYRNLILVAFFLDKERVSENASIYFPDPDIPLTRVHEPKNRSIHMSPAGKTSLVAEIPCMHGDGFWKLPDAEIALLTRTKLMQAGLIRGPEIIGAAVHRMPCAYPVLEKGFESRLQIIADYLERFRNLRLSGRNGRFLYGHIHDMMNMGREIIAEYHMHNAS
jgi:protoporphyrinogen oxidase